MLKRCATIGPTIASATVSAKGSQATGGNQSIDVALCASEMPKERATIAATPATISTRRYCMIATRRGSAP